MGRATKPFDSKTLRTQQPSLHFPFWTFFPPMPPTNSLLPPPPPPTPHTSRLFSQPPAPSKLVAAFPTERSATSNDFFPLLKKPHLHHHSLPHPFPTNFSPGLFFSKQQRERGGGGSGWAPAFPSSFSSFTSICRKTNFDSNKYRCFPSRGMRKKLNKTKKSHILDGSPPSLSNYFLFKKRNIIVTTERKNPRTFRVETAP